MVLCFVEWNLAKTKDALGKFIANFPNFMTSAMIAWTLLTDQGNSYDG